MRPILTLILFAFMFINCAKDDDESLMHCWAYFDNNWQYVALSQMPVYDSGAVTLAQEILMDIRYPSQARENNIQGTVIVQFEINEDGTVTHRMIVEDIGSGCGDEVLRVLTALTQGAIFKPAEYMGQPVKVRKQQSVKFKLE